MTETTETMEVLTVARRQGAWVCISCATRGGVQYSVESALRAPCVKCNAHPLSMLVANRGLWLEYQEIRREAGNSADNGCYQRA